MNAVGIRLFILILVVAEASAGCGTSPAKSESITGCLNLRSGGEYILTEEKTGKAVTVIVTDPIADLKPHGHNHRVAVTGTFTKEQGREVFRTSAIRHLDEVCS
jgi:hypothetical protein